MHTHPPTDVLSLFNQYFFFLLFVGDSMAKFPLYIRGIPSYSFRLFMSITMGKKYYFFIDLKVFAEFFVATRSK
jgi:hypothetical protein